MMEPGSEALIKRISSFFSPSSCSVLVSFSEPSLHLSDNAESHGCKTPVLVLMKLCYGLCLRGKDCSRSRSVMFAFHICFCPGAYLF